MVSARRAMVLMAKPRGWPGRTERAGRRLQTTARRATSPPDGVHAMWLLLKGLALRFVVGRTVGGMFAALLLAALPLAGVLKVVGLPLLAVLGVIGAPVFLL